MNKEKTLKTPILFITYKRLETTKKVFEMIREVKPSKLYISSNSGKNTEEVERVSSVRKFLEENVDWDCEVFKLFRAEHLNAKLSISGAIDWFFANEEEGIILEDDCLPSKSFFWFCEELLEKYRDDMRIGHISGDNFQNGIKRGEGDYYFSIYNHVWGWSSWANRWKNYDVNLKNFDDTKFIEKLFDDKNTRAYWIQILETMKKQPIDTWDYQWTFTLWKNDQLTILPNINMIENIGFGVDATHTIGESEFANLKAYNLVLKNHPQKLDRDLKADEFTSKIMFQNKSFFERVANKLKRIFQ